MVASGATGTAEQGYHTTPIIDAPFVTTKSVMIPPFGCVRVKGLAQLLPAHSSQVQVITEPIASHWVTWGVMATNMSGDLCTGSKHVGMVLRNLSAWEVHIPPKTVISNVYAAKKVPDWEVLGHTRKDLPLKE